MQRAILGSTPRHFVGHRMNLLFALLLIITGADTLKRLLLCGVDLLCTTRPIEYIYIYIDIYMYRYRYRERIGSEYPLQL